MLLLRRDNYASMTGSSQVQLPGTIRDVLLLRRGSGHGPIQNRAVESANRPAALAPQVEHHNFIPALFEPRSRRVERPLRPNVPDSSQRATVQPQLALGECAGIQKRVAGLRQVK